MKNIVLLHFLLLLCNSVYLHSQTAKPNADALLSRKIRQNHLKAVLVLGDMGEGKFWEEQTFYLTRDSKKIADTLRKYGIQVFEFYDGHAVWEDIVKASVNADIFIYTGHGVLDKGYIIGGMSLANSRYISPEQITRDLKLKKDALVMLLSVCYAAGSSASDTTEITEALALERVSVYALPFISIGAGACVACNGPEYTDYINLFLKGQSVESIYMEEFERYKVLPMQTYKYNSQYKVSLTSFKSNEKNHYGNSLVVKPKYSIYNLLSGTTVSVKK